MHAMFSSHSMLAAARIQKLSRLICGTPSCALSISCTSVVPRSRPAPLYPRYPTTFHPSFSNYSFQSPTSPLLNSAAAASASCASSLSSGPPRPWLSRYRLLESTPRSSCCTASPSTGSNPLCSSTSRPPSRRSPPLPSLLRTFSPRPHRRTTHTACRPNSGCRPSSVFRPSMTSPTVTVQCPTQATPTTGQSRTPTKPT
ncbi:hypothetical protein CC85DRAFT_312828 [Cutaneotrichosporon oleaginosum]|uniref:Uncharacterized protein n=1 Tax=Cutaneotrichosporon oleaginosum TaxID=879819 RepID=A0A0J1B0Y8_9TREE|nr:uncharacterized protein CC85DRAFT_312828 [Cutaneotrichosporon oleaginosum]KLT41269.1 hypothetical protein CC85DRAFT_312828 [Cutaneotrichosporon oleaginosum]TXT14020.1 hypothetical protein COLE_00213 [Cutaneotrichosporon oleaginosum]